VYVGLGGGSSPLGGGGLEQGGGQEGAAPETTRASWSPLPGRVRRPYEASSCRISGCSRATLRRVFAAPDGSRRPCSQSWSVRTDTPSEPQTMLARDPTAVGPPRCWPLRVCARGLAVRPSFREPIAEAAPPTLRQRQRAWISWQPPKRLFQTSPTAAVVWQNMTRKGLTTI
jgi:hypothetical protein